MFACLGVTTSRHPAGRCGPALRQLLRGSDGRRGSYTFEWDFGDGSPIDTAQNPTHVYAAAGNYTATLYITDNWPVIDFPPANCLNLTPGGHGPIRFSASVDITVYGTLSVSASVTPSLGMAGQTNFAFTSTVAGGTGPGTYTYLWNFGDGNTSTGANPFHVYNNPGTYSAVLTVTDTAGHIATSNAVLVTVYPLLNVTGSVSPTTVYPLPGSVTVTANALGGDGNF